MSQTAAPPVKIDRVRQNVHRLLSQASLPSKLHQNAYASYLKASLPPLPGASVLAQLLTKRWELPSPDHTPETTSTMQDRNTLSFVNGRFCSKSSSCADRQLHILPLQQAFLTHGPLLTQIFQSYQHRTSSLALSLHQVLWQEGVFVYLPEGISLDTPLTLDFAETTEGYLFSPTIIFCMGRGSRCRLRIQARPQGRLNNWINTLLSFHLEQGSYCSLVQEQTDGMCTFHIQAEVKEQARFDTTLFGNRSSLLHTHTCVDLIQEGASTDLKGLLLQQGETKVDTTVYVNHLAPATHSSQQFKQILKDRARVHFEGEIYVASQAQKTEGYQQTATLLLSAEAKAKSDPNLRVLADDVKASHGATFSPPHPEGSLYLKSRGLSQEWCDQLILESFCRKWIASLSHADEQRYARELCQVL